VPDGIEITPRELYDLVQTVNAGVLDVKHDTATLRLQVSAVHEQAKRTNGRVTALELEMARREGASQGALQDTADDRQTHADHEERLRSLERTVWKTSGLAAGISVLLGVAIKLLPLP
jgi:hypothetical protein